MRRRRARTFAGRHAVITGGSEGIGLTVARRLVAAGAAVTLVARRPDRLEEAAREVGGARTLSLDVSDEAAVAAALPPLLAEHPVDLLINSAGIAHPAEFLDADPAGLRAQMDVNYFGAVWMTRAVMPHFLERGHGHVVNVGSTAGLIGIHGYAGYTPPKAALYGLSEVLRAELAHRGVAVTIVLPGSTRTGMFERELEVAPAETRRLLLDTQVLDVEDVADALLKGVARRRFEVIPGLEGRLSLRAYRAAPALGRAYLDRGARRARR